MEFHRQVWFGFGMFSWGTFGIAAPVGLAVPLPSAFSQLREVLCSNKSGDLSGSLGVDLRKKPLPVQTGCSFLHSPPCQAAPARKTEGKTFWRRGRAETEEEATSAGLGWAGLGSPSPARLCQGRDALGEGGIREDVYGRAPFISLGLWQ